MCYDNFGVFKKRKKSSVGISIGRKSRHFIEPVGIETEIKIISDFFLPKKNSGLPEYGSWRIKNPLPDQTVRMDDSQY